MNQYEIYKLNRALKLHFTNEKYDFFEYRGRVNVSPATYDKLAESEKNLYRNIAQLKEPKTYLVGNYIFNQEKYIRFFNNESYLLYKKHLINGEYIFQEDIKKLISPFRDNFLVESSNHIPIIIKLLMGEKISLFTACAIQKIIRWTDKVPQNILLDDAIRQVNKSHKFFKINSTKMKQLLIERYK